MEGVLEAELYRARAATSFLWHGANGWDGKGGGSARGRSARTTRGSPAGSWCLARLGTQRATAGGDSLGPCPRQGRAPGEARGKAGACKDRHLPVKRPSLNSSVAAHPSLLCCSSEPSPPSDSVSPSLLSSHYRLLKMPPRGSEGYDFTPILTHYLFLFTTILALVSPTPRTRPPPFL